MEKETRVVVATFRNRIREEEMPYFRGCMIKESCNNALFHNHKEENFYYTYPLVQYRIIDGCASAVGIDEGGEAIEAMLKDRSAFPCAIGNRNIEMELIGVRSQKVKVELLPQPRTYSIEGWVPLNSSNYTRYRQTRGLAARIEMLQKILVGNILSFAKGIGVYIDGTVRCEIEHIEEERSFAYKGVVLMSFAARFSANILLPDCIGLGKAISLGKGTIRHCKDHDRNR